MTVMQKKSQKISKPKVKKIDQILFFQNNCVSFDEEELKCAWNWWWQLREINAS